MEEEPLRGAPDDTRGEGRRRDGEGLERDWRGSRLRGRKRGRRGTVLE